MNKVYYTITSTDRTVGPKSQFKVYSEAVDHVLDVMYKEIPPALIEFIETRENIIDIYYIGTAPLKDVTTTIRRHASVPTS